MPLPASGPISGSQIGAAVGASAPYSLRSMSATAGFSTPDAMSEFYNYSSGYSVTIWSKAGAVPNYYYTLHYSPDNSSWTQIGGNLSSIVCTNLGTVSISTGIIYIKAVSTLTDVQIYGRGSNSTTCPGNVPFGCTFNAIITGNEDVAFTVYVDGVSEFQSC